MTSNTPNRGAADMTAATNNNLSKPSEPTLSSPVDNTGRVMLYINNIGAKGKDQHRAMYLPISGNAVNRFTDFGKQKKPIIHTTSQHVEYLQYVAGWINENTTTGKPKELDWAALGLDTFYKRVLLLKAAYLLRLRPGFRLHSLRAHVLAHISRNPLRPDEFELVCTEFNANDGIVVHALHKTADFMYHNYNRKARIPKADALVIEEYLRNCSSSHLQKRATDIFNRTFEFFKDRRFKAEQSRQEKSRNRQWDYKQSKQKQPDQNQPDLKLSNPNATD
ncbi:hypothetical protein BDY21DRAFT_359815 [Lineolata rhizophorae]|uniref:Uncharacterized protein n=1 Tax=Lineolata rhizophorae TaxID=578093 RepID=A0A6A6PCQ2_9PEZI|nr:hypothetical protein BDY21DRAFT_359815 [Lineolata rhizophorae]